MKINRFIALAGIALLVVGALSVFASRSFALGVHAPVAQSNACAQDQTNGAEVTSATDTDNIDLQCGDQTGTDTQEIVSAADTDNVQEQVGDQTGSDNVEEVPEASSAGQ